MGLTKQIAINSLVNLFALYALQYFLKILEDLDY